MTGSDQEKKRQWGSVICESPGPVAAGSYQTIPLRFVAGSLGIDERGGIRISFRGISDFGTPQWSNPTADNYVTAKTKGDLRLQLAYDVKGNVRPYTKALYVNVLDGSLAEGNELIVVFGDQAQGSNGWRMQTFADRAFPIRVEADPFGTFAYVLLTEQPTLEIIPGKPHRFQLNVPTFIRVGEPLTLRVKCEDVWGNPQRDLPQRPSISMMKEGEVARSTFVDCEPKHDSGVLSYQLSPLNTPGVYRFVIEDGMIRDAISNPVVVAEGEADITSRYYWCDLHGQTGETVGSGTVEEYFEFGRRYGFLDGSSHQGNDFQIDGDIWQRIVKAAHDAYEEGAFVTFPGIEWSGNTPMGGDHNVLFNEPNPPLYRSTGWLAADGTKLEEVAPLSRLYHVLREHDAITIPHVGGRPAAFEETDPEVEPLVELHSAWGTFEWVYRRAFDRGFKVGFVCNSDGHKQRPGASYPGASTFGTLGGLTCILASGRSREEFWAALKSRRCYGTTGQRIFVDARVEGNPIGADIQVNGVFVISGRAHGTAPLLGIDLMRGAEVIDQAVSEPGPGLRTEDQWVIIRMGGSRVYGRERKVTWQGSISLEGNTILDAVMHGVFNPLHGIRGRDPRGLEFDFISTGNSLSICLKVERPGAGQLVWNSTVCNFSMALSDLQAEPRRLYEGPIDQFLEIFVCPIQSLPMGMDFRFIAPAPVKPETPYFVRVRQVDEAKAWTSPFYVTRK